MIFRKNLKAGTLLYALLILGVFALLLQFYIQSQLAAGYAWKARRAESQAYFMAQMTKDEFLDSQEELRVEEDVQKDTASPDEDKKEAKKVEFPSSGQVAFTMGQATYEKSGHQLQVNIRLNSGQNYSYRFPIPSQD